MYDESTGYPHFDPAIVPERALMRLADSIFWPEGVSITVTSILPLPDTGGYIMTVQHPFSEETDVLVCMSSDAFPYECLLNPSEKKQFEITADRFVFTDLNPETKTLSYIDLSDGSTKACPIPELSPPGEGDKG